VNEDLSSAVEDCQTLAGTFPCNGVVPFSLILFGEGHRSLQLDGQAVPGEMQEKARGLHAPPHIEAPDAVFLRFQRRTSFATSITVTGPLATRSVNRQSAAESGPISNTACAAGIESRHSKAATLTVGAAASGGSGVRAPTRT
jgi:hypothetical protein